MLLYLFFDFLLSTCPKKMEIEKWAKSADSPLTFVSYCFPSKIRCRSKILQLYKKCV